MFVKKKKDDFKINQMRRVVDVVTVPWPYSIA